MQRVRQRILADHEEGGGHLLLAQDVEDRGVQIRVGPVVEGQRDLLRLIAGAATT
jgi:hypothetical protein